MPDTTRRDTQERGAEESGSEAELIGRIIQSEQKLTDYFTNIITKSVTDQLERRNTYRLRLIGVISVALITLAVPTAVTWVGGTIADQTENAMAGQFEEATASLEARFVDFLDRERMYSSFTNYLLYLSDRRSVQRSEMTEVRLRLEEIAKYPSIVERREFPHLLDLATRLAVRHQDSTTLELLESDFRPRLTSARTLPRLARYYGEHVIGDRFTSEAKRQASALRFQQYVDASEHSPDFVELLPLQLMVDAELDGENVDQAREGIALHVRDLGPLDKASFIAETVRYSNPQFWEASTTARTRRMAAVAGQLIIKQRDFYTSLLDNASVQSALIDISEIETNQGNVEFANALSGFRNAFSGELASVEDSRFIGAVDSLVRNDISTWMSDDVIIDALRGQNRETRRFSRERIGELEAQWQVEFESGAFDLIENVQDRPISRLLRRLKRDSVGVYHEIFVMDGVGLIVGASDPNNDYWQGEEPKWLSTYRAGPGSLHIGTLKFDDSALAWVIQISLPVLDPRSGDPIGAVTIGLDPSTLENTD